MSRLADVVDRRHSPAKLDFLAGSFELVWWRRSICCSLTSSVCANQRSREARVRRLSRRCNVGDSIHGLLQAGGRCALRAVGARALRPATQTSDCTRAGSGCTSVLWCGCAGGTLARLEVTPACEGAWSPDAPAFPALFVRMLAPRCPVDLPWTATPDPPALRDSAD